MHVHVRCLHLWFHCLDFYLLQVTATDLDGRDNSLNYSIVYNYNETITTFSIDSDTGMISRVTPFKKIEEAGTVMDLGVIFYLLI